jgi:hypothetical protein
MIKFILPAALAAISLSGCTVPEVKSATTRSAAVSTISLVNAPDSAVFVVGDQRVSVRKGGALLSVSDGWHEVSIIRDGRTLKTTRVFVQDGTDRVIDFSTLQ